MLGSSSMRRVFAKAVVWKCPFSTLRLGIDEAGRGAVLGPLVISAVLLSEESESKLKELGVRDSKQMTPANREACYAIILEMAEKSRSIHISSKTIDKERSMGLSMNVIEENHIFRLVKGFEEVHVDVVVADAFVSKKNRLERTLKELFPASTILCAFHADSHYPCVSAASVVAKVERDRSMLELEKEWKCVLGTGYPHDPLSTAFIEDYVRRVGKPPSICRSSWITTQRICEAVLK